MQYTRKISVDKYPSISHPLVKFKSNKHFEMQYTRKNSVDKYPNISHPLVTDKGFIWTSKASPKGSVLCLLNCFKQRGYFCDYLLADFFSLIMSPKIFLHDYVAKAFLTWLCRQSFSCKGARLSKMATCFKLIILIHLDI